MVQLLEDNIWWYIYDFCIGKDFLSLTTANTISIRLDFTACVKIQNFCSLNRIWVEKLLVTLLTKKSASDQNLKRLSINQNVETRSKDFKYALSKQDTWMVNKQKKIFNVINNGAMQTESKMLCTCTYTTSVKIKNYKNNMFGKDMK